MGRQTRNKILDTPPRIQYRTAVPLTLSPALADRFARIIALLYEIVAEQGVMRLRDGPLTLLIYNRIRRWTGQFLARATVPPRPGENTRRAPRPRSALPSVTHPSAPPPPAAPARGPRLPRGHAWLLRLMQPTAMSLSQLMALLHEPEVTALLLARPHLSRLLGPLCYALGMPPLPFMPAPRRSKPAPEAANPTDTTGADPTAPTAKPPNHWPPRKFPFRRNEDLLFRLRMGTPLPAF